MPVQKRPDGARPVDRMAVENQGFAGEQERQHIDVEVRHETFRGQRALIAPLGVQALLGQHGDGVHGLAGRHRLFVDHAFTPWGAAIRQGHVQTGTGFIEVEALVEGDGIDDVVIVLGLGLMLRAVLLGIVGGLFFRVIRRRRRVLNIVPTLTVTP